MSKVKALNKKTYENAIPPKEHGAAFGKQGFEVSNVVDEWGWVVNLSHDHESVLLFANEVKAATKTHPSLVTLTDTGVILNPKAKVERRQSRKSCEFSM